MSGLGLGLGLGLSRHRKVGGAGNKPATFTIPAGFANAGTKRINFSEPVTVTMTGGVTLSIAGTPYLSGDTIPVASTYHTLTINNPGGAAGTITFGRRKQVTYLFLDGLGLSVITGDITGMGITYLHLQTLGSSVITGDITGMPLTYLRLYNIGSSSVITGKITGMELTSLLLSNIGSSLTYGTNLLNITHNNGIQLIGSTVFATSQEYARLIQDAANATWGGKHPFVIRAGTTETDPGWENVKAYVAILLEKAAWNIIPSAWLEDNGGTWPADWNEYEG
jgi:hypothetical protein